MIINGTMLLKKAPIQDMLDCKVKQHGVSHGLSEAGYDIRINQSVVLDCDNRFTLASSKEYFQMPHRLVGEVKDKSTWARKGLSVFNTVIEPGWNGYLTLELVFHGPGSLFIEEGSGIAQVLFYETSMAAAYYGKYQDAGDYPQEAIHD